MVDQSPNPPPSSGPDTQPYQTHQAPGSPTNNNQDIISVKNLQLPAGVVAPDVWGKAKEQPALLTVSLVLRGEGFGKAAAGDRLDASTIHYGELSKRIRAACSHPSQTAGHVSAHAERVIADMSRKSPTSSIVARSIVDVHLPKASMYGDGITLTNITDYDERGRTRAVRRVFVVREVKLMLLVGVNGYERRGKQPVLASLWLDLGGVGGLEGGGGGSGSGSTVALFNLEQTLVQITQDTSFETLESLAEFTVKQLQERLLNKMLPGSQVRLRLEKPRAIAFADAPAVEVFRETPGAAGAAKHSMPSAGPFAGMVQHHRTGTMATVDSMDETGGGQAERLNIIRLYM
ncbi:hypothetical protein LTR91_011633 [Friedmanniomyces endolithicus]|uniref:Dihydroneopterin aldolase/epimerase domain-containing protein n=1 Tax=Friedmanniomyces endolithicus TaxID=329885 RepID=A0AAN6KHA5_9PEZI|nr:hypothetical protein LTS09_010131 [Friedmanniomyces endolithicus]KAK0281316.1 hypothetical protein LTR35_007692 [Friedmanniomyces endolithicus]KAK0295277.1 hypothetical protein LTS00_006335 [Friedmanniomyces endolithicus]KAK0308061.1 hypothetical protein LTR01_005394 [Friedmanniomyces endolithicus]KAK0318658.1 hypothetical protein LTR82_010400 [Friedmanniomyces endolithicus]